MLLFQTFRLKEQQILRIDNRKMFRHRLYSWRFHA